MKRIIILLVLVSVFLSCHEQKISKEIIVSPDAPAAVGPFSQAVKVGNMLYLSGQLGIDPSTGKMAEGFEAQVRQAMDNAGVILKEAGFSFDDVVQNQVFVKDMSNYGTFNGIYKEYFTKDYPARALLEVSRIPVDGLVEIMMTAVKAN